jgi:hypothetical protein
VDGRWLSDSPPKGARPESAEKGPANVPVKRGSVRYE